MKTADTPAFRKPEHIITGHKFRQGSLATASGVIKLSYWLRQMADLKVAGSVTARILRSRVFIGPLLVELHSLLEEAATVNAGSADLAFYFQRLQYVRKLRLVSVQPFFGMQEM